YDVSNPSHCLHWFLYDEDERNMKGASQGIPAPWIQAVETDLNTHNPYVHQLHCLSSPSMMDCTNILELSDHSINGDFAAIIHASNSMSIQPRSILIWQNSDREPDFIPITSCHYEPLQYPVLFPHGSPGWGLIARDVDNPTDLVRSVDFTQREWYKG